MHVLLNNKKNKKIIPELIYKYISNIEINTA